MDSSLVHCRNYMVCRLWFYCSILYRKFPFFSRFLIRASSIPFFRFFSFVCVLLSISIVLFSFNFVSSINLSRSFMSLIAVKTFEVSRSSAVIPSNAQFFQFLSISAIGLLVFRLRSVLSRSVLCNCGQCCFLVINFHRIIWWNLLFVPCRILFCILPVSFGTEPRDRCPLWNFLVFPFLCRSNCFMPFQHPILVLRCLIWTFFMCSVWISRATVSVWKFFNLMWPRDSVLQLCLFLWFNKINQFSKLLIAPCNTSR